MEEEKKNRKSMYIYTKPGDKVSKTPKIQTNQVKYQQQ